VIAAGGVVELIDVAVQHRGCQRAPGKIDGVSAVEIALPERGFGSHRQEQVDCQRCGCRTTQLKPISLPPTGKLPRGPLPERDLATVGIRVVVEGKDLSTPRFADRLRTNARIGRQIRAVLTASFHERSQIATIVAPGMQAVVVGDRRLGVQRLGERKMQLAAVRLAGVRRTLVHIVEKLQGDLVGHEESQQMHVAPARQIQNRAAPSRWVRLQASEASASSTNPRVRDGRRASSPGIDLAGHRPQPPQQLAGRGGQQPPDLSGPEEALDYDFGKSGYFPSLEDGVDRKNAMLENRDE
jgi:hypothetical protein